MGLIITEQLLTSLNACPTGPTFFTKNNLWGKTEEEVLSAMQTAKMQKEIDWWYSIKQTEAFVRINGSILTMGAYQVFNPLTGVHTRYETEAEARDALVAIAKEVLTQHCPRVVQELSNENGDTTWIPTTMNETLVVA